MDGHGARVDDGAPVLLQLILVREPLSAHVATEGLLPGVRPHMYHHVLVTGKPFGTKRASEWLDARVLDLHVELHCVSTCCHS